MTNQEPRSSQNEKSTEGYRGALVYHQGYGYKLITMMVNLRTPDEQSRVVSYAHDLDIREEAEHIPSAPPLATVDVYHFMVTDDTTITLTIKSQTAGYQARYTVHPHGIEENSPFLWLDIIRSGDSVRDTKAQPSLDLDFER
ncbi:MAG: hypothetical protein J2P37_14615 [Ktedonobacteraceae bacterium]|nr:hypothetical protein [Ktedonobacteraceae bacterium]